MNKINMLILIILTMNGCKKKSEDSILFLGKESNGNIAHRYIGRFIANKLENSLQNSSEEIINTLEEQKIDHQQKWNLSRITVGLNFSAGADVKVAELESEAAFELRFEPTNP